MNDMTFSKNVRLITAFDGGDEMDKKALGSAMKRVLKAVAEELKIPKDGYDVRYNAGGTAVAGDGVLHSDNLYVSMSPDMKDFGILVRTCNGRKDYCGGVNNFISWRTFERFRGARDFATSVKGLLGAGHPLNNQGNNGLAVGGDIYQRLSEGKRVSEL